MFYIYLLVRLHILVHKPSSFSTFRNFKAYSNSIIIFSKFLETLALSYKFT